MKIWNWSSRRSKVCDVFNQYVKLHYLELLCFLLPADPGPHYEIQRHTDYFNVHNLFTVSDLFDARVHYGHKEGTLDDRMKPYIYGKRMGHIIFDLDKTAAYLRNALNFAAHIAYQDGVILFVSRQPQNAYLIEKTALACREYGHTRYWRGGIFTNSVMQFGGLTRLPDLCIFLNTLTETGSSHLGLRDAAKMLVPVIGICDSNCNPNPITYPVPGNDDSFASIEFYCKVFKEAILRAKQKRKEHLAKARGETVQPIEPTEDVKPLGSELLGNEGKQETVKPTEWYSST